MFLCYIHTMKYIIAVLFVLIIWAGVTVFVYPDILSQLWLDSVSAAFSDLVWEEEDAATDTDQATWSVSPSENMIETGTNLLSWDMIQDTTDTTSTWDIEDIDLFSMFGDIPAEDAEEEADTNPEIWEVWITPLTWSTVQTGANDDVIWTGEITPLVWLWSGVWLDPNASDQEKELLSYVDKEPLYAREEEEEVTSVEEAVLPIPSWSGTTNDTTNSITNDSSSEVLITLTLDTITQKLTDPSGSIFDGEREYIWWEFFTYNDTLYHLSTDTEVPVAEKATFSVRDGAEASDRFFNYDGATIISKNETSDLSAKEKYVREAMWARVMGE